MAVNVVQNEPRTTELVYTGLVSGSGVLVKVPQQCRDIVVTYVPTSAGTASIKYSAVGATPTDFTNMPKTSLGDFTATGGQEIQSGVQWIGLDPASGTWTLNISFRNL